MALAAAFRTALGAQRGPGAEEAIAFVEAHREDVDKALRRFDATGRPVDGRPLPAECYSDFYKLTMLPAMRATERAHGNDIRCTFSVNVRDVDCRRRLHASAIGKADPALYEEVLAGVAGLLTRPFDRNVLRRCAEDHNVPGWDASTLAAVCGLEDSPRMLAQELRKDLARGVVGDPSKLGDVLLQLFVAHDSKLQEEKLYIEATGPWHRVTWLETTLMQVVYEALLRDQRRLEYGAAKGPNGRWDDGAWYPQWLAEAFVRCVRSVGAAKASGLKGALLASRRTGGLALMLLQGMFAQSQWKGAEGAPPPMLGTSSVTARYWLIDAGVSSALVPRNMGTHAHELSMVLGAVYGHLDDEAGVPVSQVLGHMLYFFCSSPQGDVRETARKSLMPMLPDTLGSRAFLRAAAALKVPLGPHANEPILSVIGSARQDSGGLRNFKEMMDDFGFTGLLMASEIETAADLQEAQRVGYTLFGAGGFMGDSEKAWDPAKKNISMAAKVMRVYVGGELSAYTPVKTGETSADGSVKEDKFEADGTLPVADVARVRARAQRLASAEARLEGAELQGRFDAALARLVTPGLM